MNLQEQFQIIQHNLEAAQIHLLTIETEMQHIENDGMYPSVPNEQWQSRDGTDNEYLYMTFRTGPDGNYMGPNNKRKLYIGNKSPRIAKARRLARNREYWEDLDRTRRQLERWIDREQTEIQNLARLIQNWPKFEFAVEADDQTTAEFHEQNERLGR